MATAKQGAFGHFGGTIGNVVGTTQNGQSILRIRPANVKNPNSPAQARQRQAFGLITNFCRLTVAMIQEGYTSDDSKVSLKNAAIKDNFKTGLTGEYPNQELYYPGLMVAKGTLDGPRGETMELDSSGNLIVNWIDNTGRGFAQPTDVSLLMIFNPIQKEAITVIAEAVRGDKQQLVALPEDYAGQELHVWLAFRRPDGGQRSNSSYVGSVTP